jgi:outer membrane protein OmpA-like peptidoglycan-associated protein
MIDRSQIRAHMDVIDSAGDRVGQVDNIDGDRIKLAKNSSSDGQHHYVDLSDVARVDEHVHLTKTRAALGLGLGGAAASSARPAGLGGNQRVGDSGARRTNLLPWILGGLALLALIIALTQCQKNDGNRVGDNDAAAAIVTPRVAGAPLTPGTLAYDLDRFMSSKDGLPRTFTFDGVNFNSGTANLRAADGSDLDDIARVLAAYPKSRAAIVGYADAEGNSDFNRDLGANRAKAVVAALATRGVPVDRLDARTGGETTPAATNATPGGRFENRRTELVILKR